ncbi:hypothetical protein NKR23_g6867 [Pleurostoma richardsiae]|uniref:Uncharacterized protein n=1 Tax=Pleurostoma richardsiae TaxID=41990 RepID=A0AA38RJY3_9PEZI|nr:hypothetical protein NKR23_g6867 [Pleurostoma richardsiae]
METLDDNRFLDGKIALITDCDRGKGHGEKIAVYLGRCGARVAINYSSTVEEARDTSHLLEQIGLHDDDAVMLQCSAIFCEEPMTLVKQTLKAFGTEHVDITVHNSGQDVERFAAKREATLEAIPTLLFGDFRQNQHSMMHVMKDVSPFMNDGGRLINIESFYAQLNIVGIEMTSRLEQQKEFWKAVMESAVSKTPSVADTERIARLVVTLCLDRMKDVTDKVFYELPETDNTSADEESQP